MTSIWGELKRRNVVKVAAAYAIVSWLLVQIIVSIESPLSLPDWTDTLVIVILSIGFVVAVFLAWAYELTPQGMRQTKTVTLPDAVAKVTAKKLNFTIMGLSILAVGFMFVDNYILDREPEALRSAIPDRDMRSVAALPFSNESAAEENAEFFANGIHDELLTQLAKISSLRVISRTSVEEYRDSAKNMREIGRELGVATLLEGRVQRAGDMVRINVQLIDSETDEHLWAETYNRELTTENIFDIQYEMATYIAGALNAALTPGEIAQLDRAPTASSRAYDFYLSGNDYFKRGDNSDLLLAVQQYERAVQEDPEFALAWTALSRGHSGLYFQGVDQSDSRLEMAAAAVQQASDLAPDMPEAHLAWGYYYYQGFRNDERALQEWAVAEQSLPGDSQLFEARTYVYRRMGQWDHALGNVLRAVELDPRNIGLLNTKMLIHEQLRDYTSAEQTIARILEISPDNENAPRRLQVIRVRRGDANSIAGAIEIAALNSEQGYQWLWWAAVHEQNYDSALSYLDQWETDVAEKDWFFGFTYHLAEMPELAVPFFRSARATLERQRENDPNDPFVLTALGEMLAFLGEESTAIELARQAMELISTSEDAVFGPRVQLNAVRVFAAAGDFDAAITELDLYLASPGRWSIEGLLTDSRLNPIVDDPRFQALVEKYRRQ